jgi:hypothetical protein
MCAHFSSNFCLASAPSWWLALRWMRDLEAEGRMGGAFEGDGKATDWDECWWLTPGMRPSRS